MLRRALLPAVCLHAELEDDMSSDDSQQPGGSQAAEEDEESAEESESDEDEQEEAPKQLQQPAKRPLSSRVRVVQGRRKPPLAPKPKEAAPPAKRSFLTLAVSARESVYAATCCCSALASVLLSAYGGSCGSLVQRAAAPVAGDCCSCLAVMHLTCADPGCSCLLSCACPAAQRLGR
jgi:hypothetical protein